MVWTWRVRLERRTEAWTERDSVSTHAELSAQVQSHTGEARDQRRGGRNRDRCIADREGRTRHFVDITDEGDPEDDEETVVEGDVMDVRLGRPDSQPEPELNAPPHAGFDFDPARHHLDASPEHEPTLEPRGKMPRRAETSETEVLFVVPRQVRRSLPGQEQQRQATRQPGNDAS